MWTYASASGQLSHGGQLVAIGYSGHGEGKNNPAMEQMHCVGPIPRGRYKIGPLFASDTHGPACMRLTPEPGTDTFGRDGFLVHGDSKTGPGNASLGCIVLDFDTRQLIGGQGGGDKDLEVIT